SFNLFGWTFVGQMDKHVWTDEEVEAFVGFIEELVIERIRAYAADMAACSGFGWDNVKQCVVMDNKEILVAYLMKEGQRLYTPGKPFPLYSRLEKIFL
ncbi:hypothetical protein S83_034733, partial [Arachis hypogaea]